MGAGQGRPVTSLPAGAPRAPIGGAVVQGPAGRLGGVGGAPAAGRRARDELRGQPPRDAPQVQLLPQQGLELPAAAALGTTKGRVGTAGGRGRLRGGAGGGGGWRCDVSPSSGSLGSGCVCRGARWPGEALAREVEEGSPGCSRRGKTPGPEPGLCRQL